jgi:hypothetical protein
MFDRLKKTFIKDTLPQAVAAPQTAYEEMLAWGLGRKLKDLQPGSTKGFAMTGYLGNKPWKLECSSSTRDYIAGDELRARAEIRVSDDVAVLIMNRPLKEKLEEQAYEMYTDTVQTTADASLPEEMRWLAMYPEAEWPEMPRAFRGRYVVLSDKLEHAVAWVDQELIDLLMTWPEPARDAETPFMVMLLRGKAYLRMQHDPGNLQELEHATVIFTKACLSATAKLTGSAVSKE